MEDKKKRSRQRICLRSYHSPRTSSPFFRTMFSSGFKEADDSRVRMDEVDFDLFLVRLPLALLILMSSISRSPTPLLGEREREREREEGGVDVFSSW